MAASDYKIAKRTRVGLAKRFRPTATTFVLTKKNTSADSRQNNDFANRLLLVRAYRDAG